MRLLEFQVREQVLMKKPGCDFSNIVAGSSGYLRAKFHFAEDWDEYHKRVAEFTNENGFGHATLLDENNECDIPPETLTGNFFMVRMYGAGEKPVNDEMPFISTSSWKVKQEVN